MPLPGEINRSRRNQAPVRLEYSLLALRNTHNKSRPKNKGAPAGAPFKGLSAYILRRRPPTYPYWLGLGTTQ
jgi:hypothetical protein